MTEKEELEQRMQLEAEIKRKERLLEMSKSRSRSKEHAFAKVVEEVTSIQLGKVNVSGTQSKANFRTEYKLPPPNLPVSYKELPDDNSSPNASRLNQSLEHNSSY